MYVEYFILIREKISCLRYVLKHGNTLLVGTATMYTMYTMYIMYTLYTLSIVLRTINLQYLRNKIVFTFNV